MLGGVIAPVFASRLGPIFAGFTPVVTIFPIVVSFTISLVIGLVAGGYPAYRARPATPRRSPQI